MGKMDVAREQGAPAGERGNVAAGGGHAKPATFGRFQELASDAVFREVWRRARKAITGNPDPQTGKVQGLVAARFVDMVEKREAPLVIIPEMWEETREAVLAAARLADEYDMPLTFDDTEKVNAS